MKSALISFKTPLVSDARKQGGHSRKYHAKKKALGLSAKCPLDPVKRAQWEAQKAANLESSAQAREERAAEAREAWPEGAKGKHQAYRRRIKAQAYALHGNACQDCGFDNPLALQFDHIEQVRRTRATKNKQSSDQTYRGVVSGELAGKVRLVCGNCHLIRTHTEGHYTPAMRCQ